MFGLFPVPIIINDAVNILFFSGILEDMFALLLDIYVDRVVARIP